MSVLSDNLVERVGHIIAGFHLIAPGSRVGVAVSGGADSVALLHILNSLSNSSRFEIVVLHVNHGLRGAESDADEDFVRRLADSLGLPARVERAQTGTNDGNLEQAARTARRAFFFRALEQESLARVALGHTRSDQAETVLFRVLRGSGLTGLASMRKMSAEGIIRPLLTTTRAAVRVWAREQGIEWREDSSNSNLDFARNRLRQETIPALSRDFNLNLESVLAGMADRAQTEEEYWDEQIRPVYEQLKERSRWGIILSVPRLTALHLAVQRRVIRRALEDVRGDLRAIDMAHVDGFLAICASGHGHDRIMAPGVDALRSFDQLLISRTGARDVDRYYRVQLTIGERKTLPYGAGSVAIDQCDICDTFKEESYTSESADLDADVLAAAASSLVVRNWEPGDRFDANGRGRPEKIKSLFQEHRVPLWERRHWPVLVSADEIVWVRQFGTAAKYRVAGRAERALRFRYMTDPDFRQSAAGESKGAESTSLIVRG